MNPSSSCDSACCSHKNGHEILHFWGFGSDNHTACRLPVYERCYCESLCSINHKINPVTMYIEEVDCVHCKLSAMKVYGIDVVLGMV